MKNEPCSCRALAQLKIDCTILWFQRIIWKLLTRTQNDSSATKRIPNVYTFNQILIETRRRREAKLQCNVCYLKHDWMLNKLGKLLLLFFSFVNSLVAGTPKRQPFSNLVTHSSQSPNNTEYILRNAGNSDKTSNKSPSVLDCQRYTLRHRSNVLCAQKEKNRIRLHFKINTHKHTNTYRHGEFIVTYTSTSWTWFHEGHLRRR